MTSRRVAWLLALALALVVMFAIGVRAAAGSDTVRRMPQHQLEHQAQHLARHGGVTGTCAGCATLRMRQLSLELVYRAFPPRARNWAVCIVLRESAANPGAISPSHDFGLAQIHVAVHPQFNAWRLTHDPVYSVQAFYRLSRAGHDRGPWAGGTYPC